MAQCFARFGSEVFLVETTAGILPREDHDAARIVQAALVRDGVKVLVHTKDLRLTSAPGGVSVHLTSDGVAQTILADRLLVAAGRAPNVENLGLEAAGVSYDKKGVKVDDRLQTANPHIYACGDICSPYQFTHAADFMARIVIQNALFKGRKKASALVIPWSTYTSPELAHVGLAPKAATAAGIPIDTYTQPLAKVDRAILDGDEEGFVRIHVRKGTDEIVGATIVAAHAGDMIGEIALAIEMGADAVDIGKTIHPHPTLGESIGMAAEVAHGSCTDVP
eukprot:gene52220-63830_t